MGGDSFRGGTTHDVHHPPKHDLYDPAGHEHPRCQKAVKRVGPLRPNQGRLECGVKDCTQGEERRIEDIPGYWPSFWLGLITMALLQRCKVEFTDVGDGKTQRYEREDEDGGW